MQARCYLGHLRHFIFFRWPLLIGVKGYLCLSFRKVPLVQYVLQSECACTVCKYMQTHNYFQNFNYSSVCVCVCVCIHIHIYIYIYIYIVSYNMCVRTVYSIGINFDHILNSELSKNRLVANLWEQTHWVSGDVSVIECRISPMSQDNVKTCLWYAASNSSGENSKFAT